MVNDIEDSRNSAEERASAVRKAEEGAADLRKSVEKLSKDVEDYEKEYQVTDESSCVNCTIDTSFLATYLNHILHLTYVCIIFFPFPYIVQGVLAGKGSGDEEKCLEDQLGDAKVAVGSAETELKQLKTKISHWEKELEEKTKQLLSKREEAIFVENELSAKRKDVENVKLALESLPYKEGQLEALQKVSANSLILCTN